MEKCWGQEPNQNNVSLTQSIGLMLHAFIIVYRRIIWLFRIVSLSFHFLSAIQNISLISRNIEQHRNICCQCFKHPMIWKRLLVFTCWFAFQPSKFPRIEVPQIALFWWNWSIWLADLLILRSKVMVRCSETWILQKSCFQGNDFSKARIN